MSNKKHQKLIDNAKYFYGWRENVSNESECTLYKFENWIIDLSESIRRKVDELLEKWYEKWYDVFVKQFNEDNDDEDDEERDEKFQKAVEKSIEKKREQLTRTHRAILYSHNGAKFDNQFIFKSKRLKFDGILENFGIFYMLLEGGYVEFRDTIRMTGMISLDKLGKYFGVPK